MSTRAIPHLYRSVSKRHWICWQLGFCKSPMANLWNSNLLPLFPSGRVGIHVLLLLANISLVVHILHFKECDPFFEEVSYFLEIKDCSSLKVLKSSAHTSDTCVIYHNSQSWGIFLLTYRYSVQDVLAEDNLGGQLAPANQCWMYFTSCRALTVLQIDAQAIRSYLCVTCRMLLLLQPIFSGFACLSLSCLILLAKGLGTRTCDYFFSHCNCKGP